MTLGGAVRNKLSTKAMQHADWADTVELNEDK